MHIRKSVLDLPAGDQTLHWYAQAVAAMKARPISDPLSWRYQAAMHGYIAASDPLPPQPLPSAADQARFWSKCQHGSWFFLPWHRAYLSFFEKIVRRHVVAAGGPADWALPYWNYSVSDDARRLPAAFQSATLPGGAANPLFVAQRSPAANSNLRVGSAADANSSGCLGKPLFINGTLSQFGGGRTGLSHRGGVAGECERVPHNLMHGAIGGPGGWMSAFETAALDPIFWLHHSNIDRLWSVWLNSAPTRKNPTEAPWLTGRSFEFHDENGHVVAITCSQMVDTTTPLLDYQYQAVPAAGGGLIASAVPGGRMPNPDLPAELLGATGQPVTLGDGAHETSFALQAPTGPGALTMAAGGAPSSHGVHLCLENVTAAAHPVETYEVYVNVPPGANPAAHPELMAGLLPAFGLVEAASDEGGHGGANYSLDITDIVATLEANGTFDPASLRVTFLPHRTPGDRAAGTVMQPVQVGRVSLYYE